MKRYTGIILLAIAAAAPLSTFAVTVKPMGDSQFKRIESGETQQQVRDLLGAPNSTARLGSETRYTYNYLDTWGTRSIFDVTFDSDGRVEKTLQSRVQF
jgi:outer membrane protein assembly factor BamE (lipoprotein component of BamABCDE complex)